MSAVDVPLPGLDGLAPSGSASPSSVEHPAMQPPSDATVARFWSHVARGPRCWIWTGSISSPDGYGRITWRRDGHQFTLSVHRFALLLHTGHALEEGVCEHACNEPLCVRVDADHVHPSTQSANLRWAVRHGRHRGPHATGDGRSRVQRSRDVRAALAHGWNASAYAEASGFGPPKDQPSLF